MMTMMLCGAAPAVLVATLLLALYRVQRAKEAVARRDTTDLATLKAQHDTALAFAELIEKDGAGAWPPRARHYGWPAALRPYHDIYQEMAPSLSNEPAVLDDDYNIERRGDFRARMRKLLADRVDLEEVQKVLTAVASGRWDLIDREAYNGFYCCVAASRHAYRWATIPVVKVAQREKFIEFPAELTLPWPYLQRKYGVTAESGNHTSNLLHNFDAGAKRVYLTNVGRSPQVMATEDTFFRMVYTVEKMAVPIYWNMLRALIAHAANDRAASLRYVKRVTPQVRDLLQYYYDDMTDNRIPRATWMSYVQGVQAWAAGETINGKYVEYDGLSGNHVLFFQTLDAFLGLPRYLSDEDFIRYIPERQRNLVNSFRQTSFRSHLDPVRDAEMLDEMKAIIGQLRVFRASHRKRAMAYLQTPTPERLIMTAGKSVLEREKPTEIKDLLKPLDDMMLRRLQNTI